MTLPPITVAPNGARRSKADHPALPLTTAELAATAAACLAAGASAIHLHVRDDAGSHSLDPDRYREAMAAIAEAAPGMDIQISTESAGRYEVADQLTLLESLRPAWVSIAVREMARDAALAARAYAVARETGTRVQHILYDLDSIAWFRNFRARAIIPDHPAETIFVLGSYTPSTAGRPANLAPLLDATEDIDLDWWLCAFGHHEQTCLLAASERGGKPRIGFENNLTAPDGRPWRDNAEAVAALAAKLRDPAA